MPNPTSPEQRQNMIIDELDEAVDALKEFGGKEGDKSLMIDSML